MANTNRMKIKNQDYLEQKGNFLDRLKFRRVWFQEGLWEDLKQGDQGPGILPIF